MTRLERIETATSMARRSRVNSCCPLVVASKTKSLAQTTLAPSAGSGRGRLLAMRQRGRHAAAAARPGATVDACGANRAHAPGAARRRERAGSSSAVLPRQQLHVGDRRRILGGRAQLVAKVGAVHIEQPTDAALGQPEVCDSP